MVQPVFISHSSLDKATADTVCSFLEARGIACWIAPRNVPPGAKYGEAIVHAIEDSLALVFLFSEHSNSSEQVMNEIERAVSKKKPLFPLKISAITPSAELEYFISRPHWLDLTCTPLDTVLPQLAQALQQLAERDGEQSAVWTNSMLYGDPTLQYLGTSPRDTPHTPPSGVVATSEPTRRTSRKISLRVGAGVVGMLVLTLAVWVGSRMWRVPAPGMPPPPTTGQAQNQPPSRLPPAAAVQDAAYQALAQGDIGKATALFQDLLAQSDAQLQSQGYTGLAAVAWERGEVQQTLERAAQAETLDPESAYSYVLRGHLLWQQGKLGEAATAYRTATAKTHGQPWQQAVAHNRLGRIYAAQGDIPQALEQYDKALHQPANGHPDTVIAYTNKGHLLATLGKFQEAIAHYRQAQQLNPADRLSAALLQEVERRERSAQDREKRERIDQLVASLLQGQKEGKQSTEQADDWTSTPLTLALLPVQTQGTLSPRAGEEEVFLLKFVKAVQATGRIIVLERDILDKILGELKLGSSDLVNPQTAVRVGRILAARLLATGTLTRRGMEAQLSLRVIETETTRLQAALTNPLDSALDSEGVADQLATTLVQKLRATYPLQGRILQATAPHLLLNIGAEQGVTPGMTLQVLNEEPLRLDGQVVGVHQLPVGLIEVTRVEPRLAQARALEQTTAFEAGWKVKER